MTTPTPADTLSAETIDSQGSTLQFCPTGLGTVSSFLPGLTTIPQINSGEQWEDDTDIAQTKRSYYKKKLPEDPDFEIALKDKPGNSVQKTFTDLVEARQHITIRITRSSGRVQEFEFVPQDHFSGESGNESGMQMYGCIGKIQEINFNPDSVSES